MCGTVVSASVNAPAVISVLQELLVEAVLLLFQLVGKCLFKKCFKQQNSLCEFQRDKPLIVVRSATIQE